MRSSSVVHLAGVAAWLAVAVSTAAAQTTYPTVKVSGRLHTQFYYFGNEDYAALGGNTATQNNFFVRRARIEARVQLNEYITAFIQPDFAGGRSTSTSTSCRPVVVNNPLPDTVSVSCSSSSTGGVRLRDAWIDVRFSKPDAKTAFTVRLGQEKKPFSRYELTSSTNLPSIERGAGRGLIGSASNDLFAASGYLAHDVGASARVERKLEGGRMASLTAGIYNGRGESANDNNNSKSYGVRASADIWSKLSIGGSYFSHDGIVGADTAYRNNGYGVDAQWNKPGEPGLFALAEYLGGETAADNSINMTGIQAVAAYNIRMKSPTSFLYAIEPALRFDRADPDTDADDNESTLISAVLGFYLTSKAQWRIAYETQNFAASGAESISGVRTALTVSF
ncbi:MAG: OprO/OprP family phosphate-selective porin [Gemmatimonadota bacterium]|nr:OprO/OprP family phosphate-selective porin [Gemmatimonadota bacterium]